MLRATVWNEFRQEKTDERVAAAYPHGIHAAVAEALADVATVQVATLDEPSHGLTEAVLNDTDVLVWWGHMAHHEVADEVVDRVRRRVLDGMGLVVLHSGHFSKIFGRLMGTTCNLKWREDGLRERIWVVSPSHPIADGLPEWIDIEHEEAYGEHFDIPAPDELVMVSWFPGGEVFRSGCVFYRGRGKIFYFRPGHETFPTYYHPHVQRILANAVRWAGAPGAVRPTYGHFQALEARP
jgi:trehalose utilization protein